MTRGIGERTLLFYARVAGISLLLMAAAGIFANFFVIGGLIVPEDPAITANNIAADDFVFRLGVFSFIIVLFLDIVVAWALYILLKQVNKNLALLTAWFRLIYAAIFGAALFNFLSILQLLNEDVYSGAMEPNQINIQVMMLINEFNNAWTIALVFFGVHLLVLGYLVFKSLFIPKILGILVMLAGLGYLIDNMARILLSNYTDLATIFTLIVIIPGVIGEVALAIWLLVKGKKIPETMS